MGYLHRKSCEQAIEHLVVRDPYALASERNRLLTADFVTQLARKVPGISRATVIAWDAKALETAISRQRKEWSTIWSANRHHFIGRVPLLLELKSRGEDRGFHDRWVEAYFEAGNRLAWNLTSGIDGFINRDSECTVTLWEE